MNSNPSNSNNFFLLYYIRQCFPQSRAFYVLHFLLRSIGLLLCTNDIANNEKGNITITSVLSQFTFASVYQMEFNVYFAVSIVVFVFFVAILICLMVLYSFLYHLSNKRHSVFVYQYATHKFDLPPKLRAVLKVIGNMLIITSLLNQHLLDFLFFGVMNLYYEPNHRGSTVLNQEIIRKFNSPPGNPYVLLGVMNVITCFLILVLNFLFNYLSNSKSLCSDLGNVSYRESLLSNLVHAFFSFLQAIYSIVQVYTKEHQKRFMLYVAIAITALLVVNEVLLWSTFVFINGFYLIKRFIQLHCLFSGLTEVIMYFIITSPLTQKESLIQIILILVLTFIVLTLYCLFKYYSYENSLVVMLFNDSKPKKYDTLIYLFTRIRKLLRSSSKSTFISLYLLIQRHKRLCTRQQCPCNELDVSVLLEAKTDQCDAEKKKEMVINQFIIILEHEVVSSLYKLRSSFENRAKQEALVFLHLDVIAILRKNDKMAYYYAGVYAVSEGEKMSSMHLYFLHELKFSFLHKLLSTQVEESTMIYKSNCAKQFAKTLKLKSKYEYLVSHEIIKGLIIRSIDIVAKVISYKKYEIHSKNSSAKCEDLLELLHEYKEMSRMVQDIAEAFGSAYHLSQMKELSYLLYHFFVLMNIAIPSYMNDSVAKIGSLCIEDLKDLAFDEIKMHNPMIAQMRSNDSFEINYISQTICDRLSYKKSEMLNCDMSMLLPQQFNETHQIYMKLFVLFGERKYSKNSFVKTKHDTLIPCNVDCRSLPSYSEFYLMMVNMKFTPSATSRKISYHLIFDRNFQFLYSNQEFYDHFFMTFPMITMLNIDFLNLFTLNKEQFSFKKNLPKSSCEEVNMSEENKAISGFSLIASNSFFKFRNYNYFIRKLSKSNSFAFKTVTVRKEALFVPIDRIIQNVSEMNLDYEYLTRMTSLQERIKESMMKSAHSPAMNSTYEMTLNYKTLGNYPYCVVSIQEDNVNTFHLIHLIRKFKASTEAGAQYHKDASFRSSIIKKHNSKQSSTDLISPSIAFTNTSQRIISLNSTSSKKERAPNLKANESLLNNTKQNSTLLLKSSDIIGSMIDPTFKKRPNFKQIAAKEDNAPLTMSLTHWHNSALLIQQLKIAFALVLLVLIALNLYHLIEDSKQINLSRYIALINNNAFLLKGQMLFSSLFFIRECCITDGIIKDDTDRIDQYRFNAAQLMKYLISIQTDINNCDIDKTRDFYQILIEKTNFKAFNFGSLSLINTESTLFDEILHLQYYFSQLYYKNNKQSCGLMTYFRKGAFGKEVGSGKEEGKLNLEQFLLPYFLHNSFGGIVEQLDKLTKSTYQILIDFHQEIQMTLGLFNGMILIADVLCLILFYLLIIIDAKNISQFLMFFMNHSIEENSLDVKVNHLKQLASEFTQEAFKPFKMSLVRKDKANANAPSPRRLNIVSSRKGSGIEAVKSSQPPEIDNPLYQSNKKLFKPQFISIALIIITVIYCCLFIFQLFNLFINIDIYNQILHLNSINSNFIQRVPALYQLSLYYLISIILDDRVLVSKALADYESSLFSNFYSIIVDHAKDSFFTEVGESYYGFLYYQLLVIRANINQLAHDSARMGNFKILLALESQINEKGAFPLYASKGFSYLNAESCLTIIECFRYQNKMLKVFLIPGNRMNENGLNIVLDTTIQLFNTFYLQFVKEAANDVKYLEDKDIADSLMNILDIFQIFDGYLNSFIVSDMKGTYDVKKKVKVYFSVLSIIFNVFISILSYLLIFKRIERDKEILLTVGQDVLLIISEKKVAEINTQ